jgi:glycolate oxidase iron-sulfur subunit
MKTDFSDAQRSDIQIREAESILRSCVHCGFCTATCPTYLLLGDELDGPRGRIYLIKDMLENDRAPSANVVRHIDRCLSCLGCMTTCPSGVNYMHLVDHGRAHVEARYRRPLADRATRALLGAVLPRPAWFRIAVTLGRFAYPFRTIMPKRLRQLLDVAPKPAVSEVETVQAAPVQPRMRVAIAAGCVQQVAAAHIDRAAERLLLRLGCEVVNIKGDGCCGAISHHLGKADEALGWVRKNVAAWSREHTKAPLDAIVMTASGCGTVVKDYGYLLKDDEQWAAAATELSGLVKDITEVVEVLDLPSDSQPRALRVAYQDACSLAHGQGVRQGPRKLLFDAGFELVEVPEGHLCCGSAGTYSALQPDLAGALGARKVENIERVSPDVVAVGNIGCINQISAKSEIPVVHTLELLDWATGGPCPPSIRPT